MDWGEYSTGLPPRFVPLRFLWKFLRKCKGRSALSAHKCMKELVAGGGFEPPTFGL